MPFFIFLSGLCVASPCHPRPNTIDVLSSLVYVELTLGFSKPNSEYLVYNLYKGLYRLKQAPKAWYNTPAKFLLEEKLAQLIFKKT